MKEQKFIRSHAEPLIILGCMLILLIVLWLRGDPLIGREAYSILRLAENPGTWDSLSYGGRFAAYAWGTPLLLSIKPDLLAHLLPPLFGLLSFLLFWGILRRFNLERGTTRVALTITMISPPFIFLFTTLNNYFIAVSLSLLGFYFLMRNNRLLAAAAFIVMPLFNLPITIISIILLFIFSLSLKKQDLFWVTFVCTAIISTAYYLTLAKYSGSPEKLTFAAGDLGIRSTFQYFLSELGGKFGLSVFGVLLALLGILYGWQKKYANPCLFFAIAVLTILMFFTKFAVFFVNFFAAVLAAYALIGIMNRGWESQALKRFTMLIMVCGLLFSSFSFIDRHIDAEPSKEITDALAFFSEQPDGVAFSHTSRGFWLESAGKKTVMDENFAFAPNPNERWEDSERLFKTRSIEEATEVISKYDIKYVWLDKQLRDELWENREEGLQFLLEYSGKFKKVYISDEVQVWRVIQD